MDISTFEQAEQRLATTLPGYESRPQQQALARAIEASIVDKVPLLAEAGCGCIQGDAEIIVSRGGNGIRRTLRQVVEKFNGGGGRYPWDLSIPTYVQREAEDGTVRLARLVNAWCSGEKFTYTVTTNTGRTIRATDEHPFMTERGWLRLDELVVGDEVHVRGGQSSGRQRHQKPRYVRIFGMQAHPYANRFKNGSAMVPEHRLVAEAARNGLDVVTFVDRVQAGNVEGLEFLDPAVWAVHHLNENPTNNELGNLKVMTHAEHHALHADQGATSHVLYKVVTERVVSVIPHGIEMTYDLEVADDPHNFIANGFVVHNTGKSLATAIPAILSGRRTVIATATKALQDQVAHKDLPFLAEHLGVPFTYALLKGRSNYLCRQAAMEPDAERIVEIGRVRERMAETDFDGERDNLGFEVSNIEWSNLTVSSEECPGRKNCPWGVECYAELAKERANAADVVITNHALLSIDAQLAETGIPGVMLGDFEVLIVDEAHELESYARNAWTTRMTEHTFDNLLSNVRTWTRDNVDQYSDEMDELLAASARAVRELWGVFEEGRLRQSNVLEHEDEWVALINSLQAVAARFSAWETKGYDRIQLTRFGRIARRLGSTVQKLVDIVLQGDSTIVRWIETETTRRNDKILTLKAAPVELGPILARCLWSRATPILVSATLEIDGGFDYPAKRLGVTGFRGLNVGTPFDFGRQARLYVPAHIPAPDAQNRAAWSAMAIAEMRELVRASDGRALLLFTSTSQMRTAFDSLAKFLPYTCLMQGQLPNKKLAERFMEDVQSVLFATRSFFTGVDFQGEACSLVVIDKLPFPVPTEPLVSAQTELIEARGGNSFSEFVVPEMTLPLIQGFGRLIRTKADRGVVAILDPRLITKGYGKRILRSLPPAPKLDTIGEVKAFFDAV